MCQASSSEEEDQHFVEEIKQEDFKKKMMPCEQRIILDVTRSLNEMIKIGINNSV